MTDFQSLPQEQRRPDARLVGLHAERGDPQARLSAALADLEDADWGLLLAGEAALARQLAALLGPGTLRVDGRLDVDRAAMAAAGLAVADLHGDLAGARAAWLLEPDERILTRARRAGVRVIVDGTLAPGGGWPRRGADYVVYRDGVTLCGHVDAPFAALFGTGAAPQSAAPAPSDLGVALALRDAATLPLRLARAARTVVSLTERLGGAARPAGPTALLLAPDAAPDSLSVPGGVLAATRHVPDGLLLTPGLEDTDAVLARLRSGTAPASAPEPAGRPPAPQGGRTEEPAAGATPEPATDDARAGREGRRPEGRERDERRRFEGRRDEGRRDERRRFEPRRDGNRMGEGRFERRRFESPRADQPGQAQPDTARPDAGRAPDALERFTFESAAAGSAQQAAPQAQPQASAPAPAEETWEPEIVYSTLEQPPVPLTHTVSSGPDAPDETPAEAHTGEAAEEETAAVPAAAPVAEAPLVLAPDLPAAGKVDPAADLTDEQAAIYARLREWRNAEAKRQEISRFIIASNATLAEIARRVPYTPEDLRAVKGMGPERSRKYGEKILEVVRG
ncbi:HRDC domain-containing protein [Deinococcus gobiensis]|uniref:Nucleic acid-binding protein, putative, HRDC family n=1 Tax=Deinococcus gobiensis (strain DSM 21396 / JCM 16679 / CGMCC 1.7299 / I-0) TaxID=745776 RepID=H8GVX5_DEIGI|nr:HRDC domain-containing protein [Deinococcus gobiensis]AFD26840.1 Nucleic acid-binding protein, putative, HRDC family [Deinococcus gobiensis I-0]